MFRQAALFLAVPLLATPIVASASEATQFSVSLDTARYRFTTPPTGWDKLQAESGTLVTTELSLLKTMDVTTLGKVSLEASVAQGRSKVDSTFRDESGLFQASGQVKRQSVELSATKHFNQVVLPVETQVGFVHRALKYEHSSPELFGAAVGLVDFRESGVRVGATHGFGSGYVFGLTGELSKTHGIRVGSSTEGDFDNPQKPGQGDVLRVFVGKELASGLALEAGFHRTRSVLQTSNAITVSPGVVGHRLKHSYTMHGLEVKLSYKR